MLVKWSESEEEREKEAVLFCFVLFEREEKEGGRWYSMELSHRQVHSLRQLLEELKEGEARVRHVCAAAVDALLLVTNEKEDQAAATSLSSGEDNQLRDGDEEMESEMRAVAAVAAVYAEAARVRYVYVHDRSKRSSKAHRSALSVPLNRFTRHL